MLFVFHTIRKSYLHFFSPILILFLSGCISCRKVQKRVSSLEMKFLNQYVIPYNFSFDNTTVGGLSGIDYDSTSEVYYSISDDRSAINPARFYTFKMNIKNNKIDTVVFLQKTFLKNPSGNNFPSATATTATIDPEALRRYGNNFFWSSEGERIVNNNDTILLNPEIYISDVLGNYLDTLRLPGQVKVSAGQTGIRQNGAFEGLAFSPDGKFLFVSVEEPLLQDGPRAGLGDSAGVIRIIKYDLQTKKPVAQYAYTIDPVVYPVQPASGFRVNGISDIMCIGNNKLLVIERSFSTGRLSCSIRVYETDLSTADDISSFSSLQGKNYKPAVKKQLLNMDNLGIYIDNIEGVTYGPELTNGNRSLIFIADNNFNAYEKTQLLLFELSGK